MPRTKISEFSATAASNTDIDSINIAEGCAPSGINDAIRELMSQLKDFQTGAVGDSFNGPIGSTTASTGAFTNITASGTLGVTGVATLGAGAILNTPASVTLTNATGLPLTTGTTGTLATTNGGTGLTSFTANGVVYASSSSALTTGSALVFDGTNFGVGTSNPAAYGKLAVNGSANVLNGNFLYMWDSGNTNAPGMYAPGDAFAWKNSAGSTEWMRINSTGLGIGTSSPSEKLQVNGALRITAGVNNVNGNNGAFLAYESGGLTNIHSYNSSGGSIVFNTNPSGGNTTERMRLDSSGNLGLGVTPSAWGGGQKAIQVLNASFSGYSTNSAYVMANAYYDGTSNKYISSSYASMYRQDTSIHSWHTAPSGTAGNAITFTQAMTLDASGNLGLGLTSPSSYGSTTTLSIGGKTYAELDFKSGTTLIGYAACSASALEYTTAGAYPILFKPNNSEAGRFDSSGKLLVGTSSIGTSDRVCFASPQASLNTLSLVSTDDASGGNFAIFRNSAYTLIGSVTRVGGTNAVTYNTTSDYRLKTVVGSVTGQGARIDALKPIDYLWIEGGQQARGFLAHEFQTVYPSSVNGVKDAVDEKGNPVYQGMQASTAEVIADLVAEIQSLRKRLADAGI